jgi:hypothetical protein
MRAAIAIIGIILIPVVGDVIWGIGVNNQLVQAEQGVNDKWAQVQTSTSAAPTSSRTWSRR